MNKIKDISFGTAAVVHPYWAAKTTLKRMVNISQGPRESNNHYGERVLAQSDVLTETVGSILPDKLVASNAMSKTKDKAREQFLVMIMLDGADKVRYGALLQEMHNSYIAKIDKYPKTIEETVNLLTNYQTGSKPEKGKESDKKELEHSFGQFKGKKPPGTNKSDEERHFKCGNCGKYGHYTDQCNKPAGSQHNQSQEEGQQSDDGVAHWYGSQIHETSFG